VDNLLTATIAFLVAGYVKGVLGFGFPLIAIAFLTLAAGLFDALALVVLPALVTNLWQAFGGDFLRPILKRMKIYFIFAVAGILAAGQLLDDVRIEWLTALLGVVLFVFAVSRLLDIHITVPARREPVLSVALGFGNGLLTGFTGVFMVPSVVYMQALGFGKEMLVQAMGVFFALSTLTLMVTLGSNQLLDWHDVGISTVALVPSFLGMAAGRRTRAVVDEALFQRLFLASIVLLGAFIAWRSLAR